MKQIIYILTLFIIFCSCGKKQDNTITITTKYGDIVAILYDDTPIHRDNFLHQIKAHTYDSCSFHRVIPGFMAQGGDVGSNDQIEAEIHFPEHYHQIGALCMARLPDKVNPEKKSSATQFYIVSGTTYSDDMLDEIEAINNRNIKNQIFYSIQPFYEDSLKIYQQNGMYAELSDLQFRIMAKVEELFDSGDYGHFSFPDSIRERYKIEGGAAHLDGNYTIFGQVIKGLDLLDSIKQNDWFEIH